VTDDLPLDVKFGAAFRRPIRGRDATLAYDADVYLIPAPDPELSFYRKFRNGDQSVEHHLGAELFLYPELPLRLGVASNEGFSCGAGFYFREGRFKNLKLDYVFSVEKNGSGLNNGVSWTYPW
jgi:hypothetical protein